jgi:hypothetical protein
VREKKRKEEGEEGGGYLDTSCLASEDREGERGTEGGKKRERGWGGHLCCILHDRLQNVFGEGGRRGKVEEGREWRVESGEWRVRVESGVESGEWRVESGEWRDKG